MDVDENNVLLDVEELKSAICNAQSQIKSNAYDYDGYTKLISSLSELYSVYKANELKAKDNEKESATKQVIIAFNKLRNARKSMAAVFPLSVELWIKWIEDELNGPLPVNHSIVQEIFSNATVDYLSVDIWCLYMNYLINKHQCDGNANITEVSLRENFEKAIISCGLHYKDGHKIWELYQKFELNIVLEAKEKLIDNNCPENIKHFKCCLLNLIKLFKRQMHVPLEKHNDLLKRFTDTINPLIENTDVFGCNNNLFKIEELERILADTADAIERESIKIHENYLEEYQHSSEAYQLYITHELDTGLNNPSRVQCLYERALIHHCLKPSLWLDYIVFLNDTLKQSDLALVTCKRALRNVTWDSRIYLKYVMILEQTLEDEDKIQNVYEMGLEKYCDNGVNYCNIWMSYVSFEKRTCDSKASLVKKKPRVYELIQKALNQFEGLAEPDKFVVEFMMFWIKIEKFWFDDESKNESILKYFGIKYRKNYSVWFQIITLARATGNKNLVNDLFSIGLEEYADSFEQLGHSWLNFENIFGNLESYNQLEKKILIHVPSRIYPRKTKDYLIIKSKTEHQNKQIIGWLNRAENQLFSIEDQHKVTIQNSKESSKEKKRTGTHFKGEETESKDEINNESPEKKVVFVKQSNNDTNSKTETNAPVIGPVMPPGFLQSNNDNTDDDSDEMSDDFLMPPPKKLKFTEKNIVKKDKGSEDDERKRTVYVSNLHPATSENDLKIIFGRAGEVIRVDLHRQRGGKIFAFVIFSKPEEAENAFQLEHTPIRNRPVFVSKFNQSKEKQAFTHHYSQQEERNKLFVSNLDKSITPNDLEKLFNRLGDMTSLRLINKKGKNKPFAFVEYKTEADAARYRNEINNTIVRGRQIVVEFSDPGRANQSDRQRLSLGFSSNIEKKETKLELKDTNDKNNIEEMETDEKISRPTDVNSEKELSDPTSGKDSTVISNSNLKENPLKKSSFPRGLIPTQARNMRNVQPAARKPKGPAVRLNVFPVSSSSTIKETSSVRAEEPIAVEDKSEVPSSKKTNDDFRKMILNN